MDREIKTVELRDCCFNCEYYDRDDNNDIECCDLSHAEVEADCWCENHTAKDSVSYELLQSFCAWDKGSHLNPFRVDGKTIWTFSNKGVETEFLCGLHFWKGFMELHPKWFKKLPKVMKEK